MSIDRCHYCDRFIDTDDDPDCYVEAPSYNNTAHPVNPGHVEPIKCRCVCGPCRERYVDELE